MIKKSSFTLSDSFLLEMDVFEGNCIFETNFETGQWEIDIYWKYTFLTG